MNLTQDQIDDLLDFYDSHPNVTIRELARMFKVPVHTVKHILLTY